MSKKLVYVIKLQGFKTFFRNTLFVILINFDIETFVYQFSLKIHISI